MKPLPALFIVAVIDVLGFGILVPLVPYMAAQYGASPALNTPILGIYSLCQLLAAPLWGRLSDRFGRRPILISSMFGACLSYLLLAATHSVPMLFVARGLAGFMAGNLAAAMAYASDISAPSDRARSLGTVGAAIGIGFMLGPAIGGSLAGNHPENANFVLPALVAASLSVLAMLLVIFVLPESLSPEQRARNQAAGPRPHPWVLLGRLPALRALTIGTILVTFSQSTLESIFAIWAKDLFHVGPRTVGFSLFAMAVVAVGVQGGLMRRLAPRFGEIRLAYAGIAALVLGLIAVGGSSGLTWAIIGLTLCGLGAGLYNPAGSALASHQAQLDNRGAVMGAYQSGTSVARVIAPLLAGLVYMHLGAFAPYLLAALVTLQALWCIRWVQNRPTPNN